MKQFSDHPKKISEKRAEELKNYMQSVLDEEQFKLAMDFFSSIWENTARYKVFIARRCLNFMYLFYLCYFYGYDKDDEVEKTIYSDVGLLSNIPEIAESYLKFKVFPKILIIDDILIHGRSINTLIDSYILSILEYLEKQGTEIDRSVIERDILNSITIKVMVRNKTSLLIRSRYYDLLESNAGNNSIWSPKKWHELSANISLLVSEGFFSNTSFALSAYEDRDEYLSTDLHQYFEESAKKEGFIKSNWKRRRYDRDTLIKPLANDRGDIVAFYTLRITQNAIDKSYGILPFVIMSDFIYKSGGQYIEFENLFDSYKKDYRGIRGMSRGRAESLYLILSYNIMLLLRRNFDSDALINCNIDSDKINFVFKNEKFSDELTLPEKLVELKKPILSWEQMDRFILKATEGSEPLFRYSLGYKFDNDYYDLVLKNALAREGEERERIAFLEYNGQKINNFKAQKRRLNLLFEDVTEQKALNPPRDLQGIADVIGNLLRYMDTGVVALHADSFVNNDQSETISCLYRAGEQSCFIRPRRYSRHLSVLAAMENDCGRKYVDIENRIKRFYSSKPKLADELSYFVKILYDSGQWVSDWDINSLGWVEKDISPLVKTIPIFQQMIMETAERIKMLKLYREEYPDPLKQ